MNYVLDFEELRPALGGGQRVNTVEGDYLQPEVRYTFLTGWSQDDMNAHVAVNYIGEFDGNKDQGFAHLTVDSMTTVDLTYNYLGIENTVLTLGVTNLFDEEPPFDYGSGIGFASDIHSAQGRFAYVKATYNF